MSLFGAAKHTKRDGVLGNLCAAVAMVSATMHHVWTRQVTTLTRVLSPFSSPYSPLHDSTRSRKSETQTPKIHKSNALCQLAPSVAIAPRTPHTPRTRRPPARVWRRQAVSNADEYKKNIGDRSHVTWWGVQGRFPGCASMKRNNVKPHPPKWILLRVLLTMIVRGERGLLLQSSEHVT